MKRGDGGDQPGRGPGLEDVPKQPAGPAAGLGPRVWGQRRAYPVDPAGTGEARRIVLPLRRETRAKLGVQERGSLAGSGEKLVTGVAERIRKVCVSS